MGKNRFEKNIDKNTNIENRFDKFKQKIDYKVVESTIPVKKKGFSWIIPFTSIVATCVVVGATILLINFLPKVSENTKPSNAQAMPSFGPADSNTQLLEELLEVFLEEHNFIYNGAKYNYRYETIDLAQKKEQSLEETCKGEELGEVSFIDEDITAKIYKDASINSLYYLIFDFDGRLLRASIVGFESVKTTFDDNLQFIYKTPNVLESIKSISFNDEELPNDQMAMVYGYLSQAEEASKKYNEDIVEVAEKMRSSTKPNTPVNATPGFEGAVNSSNKFTLTMIDDVEIFIYFNIMKLDGYNDYISYNPFGIYKVSLELKELLKDKLKK